MTDRLGKILCKDLVNENKMLKERITKLEYSIVVYAEQKKQLREEIEAINRRQPVIVKRKEDRNYDELFEEYLKSDYVEKYHKSRNMKASLSHYKSQLRKNKNSGANKKRFNTWYETIYQSNIKKQFYIEVEKLREMIRV